jgi:hypothetical protein
MNKKFRGTQRVIDQCHFHLQREFDQFEQKLKGRNQPVPISEVTNFLNDKQYHLNLGVKFFAEIGQNSEPI